MKRLRSLDFMKGLAIFLVVVVHAFAFGIFIPDGDLWNEFLERNPIIVIIALSPLMIASSWGSVFVLLTGIGLGYTIFKQFENPSKPRLRMWHYRKLVSAILLLIVSRIFLALFIPIRLFNGEQYYSLITGSIHAGRFIEFDSTIFLQPTMLTAIAASVIIMSTFLYIVMVRLQDAVYIDGKYNSEPITKLKNLLLIFALIWTIISIALDFYNRSTGFIDQLKYDGNYWGIHWTLRVFGGRNSIFPVTIFGFVGVYLGVKLAEYYIAGLDFGHMGYNIGYALIGSFFLYVIFFPIDLAQEFSSEYLNIFFQLASMGVALLIVNLIIMRMDIQRSNVVIQNRSVNTLIDFGKITLTIYILEGLVGALFYQIFRLVWGPDVFPWNGFASFLYIISLLITWHVIVQYWKTNDYKGSFEWIVKKLINSLSKTKSSITQDQMIVVAAEAD